MPLKSVNQFSEDEYYAAKNALLENESLQPTEGQPDPAQDSLQPTTEVDPTLAASPEGDGNFVRGLKMGVEGLQATGGGLTALAGMGARTLGETVGSESLVDTGSDLMDSGMETYIRNNKEAQNYVGDVAFVEDVYEGVNTQTVTNAGNWFAHALGKAVPDLALALGTGFGGGLVAKQVVKQGTKEMIDREVFEKGAQELAEAGLEKKAADYILKENAERMAKDAANKAALKGSLTGTAVYSGVQGAGNSFAQILEETGVEAPLTALGLGVVTGGLEVLPFSKVYGSMFPKGSKDEFQDYIAAKVADKPSWVTQAISDLGQAYGVNVATEMAQYIINEEAITFVNNRYGEQAALEYGRYITTPEGRSELLNVAADSMAPATILGAGTVGIKKFTGQYGNPTDFGDEADLARTGSMLDQELNKAIQNAFAEYEQAASSDRTNLGRPEPSERPIDPVTGKLATQWNQSGALDPKTSSPYTEDQIREAQIKEGYDRVFFDDNAPTPTEYESNQVDTPEATPDAPQDPAPIVDQENSEVGENTELTPAPDQTTVQIAKGTRDSGPAHRWDAELSPADQSVPEQLLQLSIAARSEEAMDPNNTDVVIEPIDQDDVDRIFDRNAAMKIPRSDKPTGRSMPTLEEAYGDDSGRAIDSVAGVVSDLSASGVPASFLDAVSGVYVHKQSDYDAVGITGQSSRGISINDELISGSLTDQDKLSELAWTMTHEVYHAADFSMSLSEKDSRLGITIDESANDPTAGMGSVMRELYDNWNDGTELGKRFDYPFNELADDISDAGKSNEGLNVNYRQEVFAQLGALFHSNPKQLQELAPQAYNYIKGIRDSNLKTAPVQEITDEQSPNQESPDTSQPEGISGEIRAPPQSGSSQSLQPDPVGRDGEEGTGSERADSPVEGQVQDEVGQRERPAVQESDLTPEQTNLEQPDDQTDIYDLSDDDFDELDRINFIKKGAEYLLEESKGELPEKKSLPVKSITAKTNATEHIGRVDAIVAKHPDALSSPEAWRSFERDLTGSNTTLAPPYGLIKLFNDMDGWTERHSKLTPEQLEAANRGLATAQRMGDLYESGAADAEATGKLLLWGLMSRRLTASAQEAGFVDLLTNSEAVTGLIQKALTGSFSDKTATRMVEVPKTKQKPKHMVERTFNEDVAIWRDAVQKSIPEGSFGRSGTSNANDFGTLMLKMSELDGDGVSKLQRLHDIMADRSIPTFEVRRQFQALVQGSGIDNKVFSFVQLMIGRDDVVILDRIQLNSMWDTERYGKNIYSDIANEFSALHGAARYEVMENALKTKIKELYTRLGRPNDASVGRYHWESWVRDSGQVVAHPTMKGLERDIKGEKSPYAFMGAPEGKMNTYAYGAIYARDDKAKPYYVYPDSKGVMHKFRLDKWNTFKSEIKNPKNGIVDEGFSVREFNKGTPWYESEQVNRQKLDELVRSYAEREATPNEYGSEGTVASSSPNGSRRDQRKRVYKELRSARPSDSGSGTNEGSIPRSFRRRTGRNSQVLVAGQKVSGSKRELETNAKSALASVDAFNGTVIELAPNKTNAKLFASKIQAGKDANKFGAAVYVYPESEYQKMKMFMTEDGSAGIAIENGDTIVSVYSDGTNKNVTFALGSLAVEEGAVYADAFDTQLPIIYEDIGLKVVSRLKWDDAEAPFDWDKQTFERYNKGEPDVVFMALDPEYFGPYTTDTGYYVDTYAEGMRSIRETRRPEQERISPKLKQAVQDRIDRKITAAELNDTFRKEGRYVKPMHPDMVAPLEADSKYVNALAKTNTEKAGAPSKETFWMADVLINGKRYGIRLDIPAYNSKRLTKDERANIVTLHAARPRKDDAPFAGAASTRLGYYPTMRLKNVLFASPQKGATNIALGADKNTIATIEGDYVAADHEQNRLDFIAAMDDPAWTQVSMNPERHTFFYDLETQTPVISGSEVIQVGNLVLVKDAVPDDVENYSYIKKKQINKETNTLDDGSPSTNQFSYNDEIDGQSDLARRLKGKKIYRSLVDRYAPLEDFEDQAADFLGVGRLLASISPRDQENLSHGKVQNDLDAFHDNYVDPLGDLITELKADPDAVGTYLIAKHAAERNDSIAAKVRAQRKKNIDRTEREIERLLSDTGVDHSVALATQKEKLNSYKTMPLAFQDTGSGMTYDQAASVLNLAEKEGTKADMERIANKVYEMLQHQRDIMIKSGLIDEDTVSDWEANYQFYVPLKGFAAAEDGDTYSRNNTSRGFSVVGSESMRAKGRKTLPVNPLFTAIEDVQMKIIRAQKNKTAQVLLDLLSELGNSDSYTIYNNKFRPPKQSDELTMQDLNEMSRDTRPNGDPKYVEVKKGGQTFFIEFKSDSLNHALQDMSVPMLSRANDDVSKLLTLATRFQTFRRNMYVNYNPSWGLVNPLRDVQTGLMYALASKDKLGSRVQGENLIGKMAASYLPSMRSMYRVMRGKPVREGTLDQYAAEFMEDGASTGIMLVRDQDEQLRILKNKLKKGYTREALRAIATWVEDFNTTMENAIRLAAYTEARKAGTERDTAASLAKDLTVNFNRKGENTAVVNAGYLFFNAAVQGNVNIVQALSSDTGKVTTAQKTAAGLVALGGTLAAINIITSDDDDDEEKKYADLPEHAKNRALLFMYNSDEGFALPASYGYNFFTNIGRLGAELAFEINTAEESALYLWENFLLNFVPIAPASGDNWEEKLRGFAPDLLELEMDFLANKNFFNSPIYIEQNPFTVERSNAYNSRRSSPKAFTAATEFLNDATGGDKYEPGFVSLNPDKIKYTYEYFLGGVGKFVSQSSDVAARMMSDEEFRKQDLPVVGTFFESPSEYKDRFEFYANIDESEKIMARIKEASNVEELQALRTKYESFIPVLENLRGGRRNNSLYAMANRDLKNISKTRRIVEKQNIPDERRKELLKELLDNENAIFDIYNKAYRKAEKGIKN